MAPEVSQAVAQQISHSLTSELPANIGAALALVPTLEWAKRSTANSLAWVNDKSAPAIAVLVAACAAAGIHGIFGQTWDASTGTWHVEWTIQNITFLGVLGALYEVGKQWLGQHWTYKLYQAFDTFKSVAIALNKMTNVPTRSVSEATPEGAAKAVDVKPPVGGGLGL